MIEINCMKINSIFFNWKLISFILSSFSIISYGFYSPCPSVLSYRYDGQRWTGQIVVLPDPEQQVYNLTVNILTDIELFWPDIGNIEVKGTYNEILAAVTQGSHLIFKLNLPYDMLLNQITKIAFNHAVLCEISSKIGYNVREITLYHTLKKYDSYDPQINNTINYFQNKPLNNVQQPQFRPQLSTIDFSRFPQVGKGTSEINFNNRPLSQSVTIPSIEISKPVQMTDTNIYNPDNIKDVCGSSEVTLPLITKGSETFRGEFPWVVTVFKVSPIRISFVCAGTLISRQHVVTAAHCIKIGNKSVTVEELVVFLGKYNLRNWSESSNIVKTVTKVHIHPEYTANPTNFIADIAIITLEEKVTFTSLVRPVCLWNGSDELILVEGLNGTVVGWGKNENGEKLNSFPKKVQLPIVSQEVCLRAIPYSIGITSTRTFCAGRRDGAGPCSGDSGSGFLLVQNNRWALRGIVSISLEDKKTRTCDLNQYLIFTDVAKFRSWVLNIIENL